MSENIFGSTKKFNESVEIINKLDIQRFGRILQRIIQKFGQKNERIFTESEETQLQNLLKITSTELDSVLECCSFIFEQTAYYTLSGANLSNQLKKTSLNEDKVQAFESIWSDSAQDVIGLLRQKTVSPLVLDDVAWRLHYQMSSSTSNKKQATAIFEFDLKSTSNNTQPSTQQQSEKLLFEFNKDQLTTLFHKLESIQEKLDTLT
ncbi:COMM domain-containing protein 10 [Tieghemostelium lacteum]|uniref:COMM domain-containing protein 10 n=1 Tax=Tieghemostelium lacteum TaxID=361077 RepID=A0A151ZK71_TIELA|nr:COMM domain-containing protein 10 [Tieghemostelium lacteum]|eukprot:KYQ94398.1 COMM domain-containing protein 10 [Tieghemostelium lacteum]